MIRDKIIQKRIRGKALAVAMTAVMASLFVPMVGKAADEIPDTFKETIPIDTLDAKAVEIGTESGGCPGHTITGNQPDAKNSIIVRSGVHYIQLVDANVTSTASVLQILGDAKVNLILENNNALTGGNAGINVSQDATLNIMEKKGTSGTLKVKATGEGAGIGGEGAGTGTTAGFITIESGTIIAQGGNRAAGIGGTDGGGVKGVTINGGTVVAKGGDGIKGQEMVGGFISTKTSGAPGIGHGNTGSSGEIAINGGKVTAIGGKNLDKDGNTIGNAYGISGRRLSSDARGGSTVIVSDEIHVDKDDLSGLVWDLKRENGVLKTSGGTEIDDSNFMAEIMSADKVTVPHGAICTVHNHAEMPEGFQADFNDNSNNELDKDGNRIKNTLIIPTGTSFKIPAGKVFNVEGIVIGYPNATIVNPEQMKFQSGNSDRYLDPNMKYKVSFDPTLHVIMKKEKFPYKGKAYETKDRIDNEIFSVQTTCFATINDTRVECAIDIDSYDYSFEWNGTLNTSKPNYDIEKNGVKDAGNYKVTFTYGSTVPHSKEFVVEPLSIKDPGVEVVKIPDKQYKGDYFTETDFLNEVVVTYNKEPVSSSDYTVDVEQKDNNKNVGDGEITLIGKGNFTDTRKVPFKITQIVVDNDNTVVTLENNADWEIEYDGSTHKPAVDTVTVKPDGSAPIELSQNDYKVELEGTTAKDDFINAGVIKVRITPKNNSFKGEYVGEFTIKRRKVKVQSIKPLATRPYNAKADIAIDDDIVVDLRADGVNKDIILPRDRAEGIELPTGVIGIIADENGNPLENAVVKPEGQSYSQVVLDDIPLSGKGGNNYSIEGTYTVAGDSEGNYKLLNPIIITKRGAPTIQVTGEAIPDENNDPRFICKLTVTAASGVIDPDSQAYCFRYTDGEELPEDPSTWGDSIDLDKLSFDNIEPYHQEKFYVVLRGTSNVEGTKDPYLCTVDIPKYPRKAGPPEGECSLTASETPNEDGESYKLTVTPEQQYDGYGRGIYLYSLSEDGEYFEDPGVLFDNVAPNSKYTAYIKYAETDLYTQSETATPTNEVETKEGEIQQPTVTCGETTASEGEIHFSGTANVTINYPGKLPGYEIRYTLDGGRPNNQSALYTEPITVTGNTTINAFVIVPGAGSSKLTTVSLINDGGTNDPNNPNNPSTGMEVELQQLTQDTTPALIANTGLAGRWSDEEAFKEISAELATPILNQRGYENNNITYADLKIKIKGTDRYATEEDFKNAKDGIIRVTVTMDQLKAIGLPASYDATNHNFAVTHMFSMGTTAGTVEAIGSAHNYGKSSDGKSISFDLKGTSPVAFGWADINNSDPTPIDPNDPTNPTDPTDPNNPTDPTDPTNPTDPTDPNNPTNDPNTLTADGEPRSGDDGTTTNTDAGTQGVSDDAASALSGIMPKTGDPLSFVPWIAAAVLSVAAIVYFGTRKTGKKKKQTVKKTQAAKKKK